MITLLRRIGRKANQIKLKCHSAFIIFFIQNALSRIVRFRVATKFIFNCVCVLLIYCKTAPAAVTFSITSLEHSRLFNTYKAM